MKRPAKFRWLLPPVLVLVLVGIFAVKRLLVPSTLSAEYVVPESGQHITLRLKPSHPFLAEYKRALTISIANGSNLGVDLFEDTGGYSRTQLYRNPDGSYVVKGYFDAARISANTAQTEYPSPGSVNGAAYVGAFDFNAAGEWQFLNGAVSPEESMKPHGG